MSTYVNPRPQPVRLVLSDGSERTIRAWGLAFVPDSLQVRRAEYAQIQPPQPVTPIQARYRPKGQAA